jgi:pimeloyl-ACP methyl ester carboxylesterase
VQSHDIAGGGGVELRVGETGDRAGRPVLFVHGYTQSRLAWDRQLRSELADDHRLVAMDVRGHGDSEKPESAYDDSALWADDVQAVIEGLDLADPVLVGWSYGGLVLADYLATYGTEHVAGINLVGAISKLGTEDALAVIGDDYLDCIPGFESTDAEESVAALETFVSRCVAGELSPRERYRMLGYNVVVPPHVRTALHSRTVTHDDDLRAVDVPALVSHGEADGVVLPSAAEEHAELLPDAELSWYPDAGHSPFFEAPERFNRELREFVEAL